LRDGDEGGADDKSLHLKESFPGKNTADPGPHGRAAGSEEPAVFY
jgi:hypothetical protein